jgi:hypothetical protein
MHLDFDLEDLVNSFYSFCGVSPSACIILPGPRWAMFRSSVTLPEGSMAEGGEQAQPGTLQGWLSATAR